MRKYSNLARTFLSAMILAALTTSSIGQKTFRAEFIVKFSAGQKVFLYSYYGDQRTIVDSAVSNDSGVFAFEFPGDRVPGIYHIGPANNEGLDFIFNRENSVISIDKKFSPDSAIVSGSVENKILFDYMSKKIYYQRRLDLLGPLVQYYPSDDPFYETIDKQFQKQDKAYTDYLEGIYKKYPDLIVTRFIKFDQLEDIRPGENSPDKIVYLKQHYFDGIDLSDTLLLYSPLLPGRIIDYLSLFVSPGIGKEKQEVLFEEAIDSLMSFTLPGSKVREVVVNYLVEGFQAYGLEDVMAYLVENYVLDQSCVSEQREEVLKKRIEGFNKLAVGNKVPDIASPDINGNDFRLSASSKKYSVLFFWSSECPHCKESIPEMLKIAKDFHEEVEFVAISVDSDAEEWKKTVRENGMDWINIAEMEGWDGKIVNDYYIYATPTILVVDRDLTILDKPNGVRDLQAFLEKLQTRR